MTPIESLKDLKDISSKVADGVSPEVALAAPKEAPQVETPAKDASPAGDTAPAAKEPAEAAPKDEPTTPSDTPAEEPPKWAPNFKLKVMDQEAEIPEFLRPLIKDEATEKEIRDFATKALGLEFAKPKHEALKTQHQTLTQEHTTVKGRMATWEDNLNRLQNAAAADPTSHDFEQFLNFWKVPKQKLYQYVAAQLQYEDLAPEERAKVDRARETEVAARQANDRANHFQQAYQNTAVQQRLGEVDRLVQTRSDIDAIAKEFGQRKGDPRAFQRLVTDIGSMTAARTGKDLSAEEAIREAMSFLGYEEGTGTAAAPAPASAPAAPAEAPVIAPAARKALPVIPTIGSGSGAAPVQKVAGSLADLRKARADMLAQSK